MKEFVLLFRLDILSPGAQPNKEQLNTYMEQWMQWMGSIAAKGQLANGGNHLQYNGMLLRPGNIASFTTAEEDNYARPDVPFDLQTALTAQGALFHAAAPWSANSIADGRIVTGQNPASAKGVGEKIAALLESNA